MEWLEKLIERNKEDMQMFVDVSEEYLEGYLERDDGYVEVMYVEMV